MAAIKMLFALRVVRGFLPPQKNVILLNEQVKHKTFKFNMINVVDDVFFNGETLSVRN